MTLVTTRAIIDAAYARGSGVGAFNVIQLEHAEAIVDAAEQCGLPVILQVSENAIRYHRGNPRPLMGACVAIAAASGTEVSVHLDHASTLELCQRAFDAGASSYMFDASMADYASNVRLTREATDWGHANDLWVEAELGEVGGKKGAHAPGARTDPEEARLYVAETGVDGLAIAIGSSHAMVEQTATLDLQLLSRIRKSVAVPLVLHGSSGVPRRVVQQAVTLGITKVNISTQLNRAMTEAIRGRLSAEPALVDPRTYLGDGRTAVTALVSELMKLIAAASAGASLSEKEIKQ